MDKKFCEYKVGRIISNSTFCSYLDGPPAGICWWDWGSPALMPDGVQVGTSLWIAVGPNGACQSDGHVSGFVKVSYYIDDIEQITGLKRSDEGYFEKDRGVIKNS